MSLSQVAKRCLHSLGFDVSRGPSAVMIRRIGRRKPPQGQWAGATGLKLNLGCGGKPFPGWVNVDIQAAPGVDLVAEVTRLPMLPAGCAAAIHLDAVYEHLYRWERPEALAEWLRLLAPGGTLTVRWIPDFDVILELYRSHAPGLLGPVFDQEHVYRFTHGLPTPFNAAYQIHKDLFTKASVRAEFEASGFEVAELVNACFEDEAHAININVVARKPGGVGAGGS